MFFKHLYPSCNFLHSCHLFLPSVPASELELNEAIISFTVIHPAMYLLTILHVPGYSFNKLYSSGQEKKEIPYTFKVYVLKTDRYQVNI